MKTTVLFQGDSITDCGRTTVGGTGLDNKGMGAGYPAMVRARLMCDHPDIEWTFLNRGISGNRMVDLYARWRVDCINLQPDVLSILIGANDSLHEVINKNGVDLARSERIYREMLDWVKRELPKLRLVILEPFTLFQESNENNDFMTADVAKRGKFTKKLAAEFDAVFIPSQSILNKACKRAPKEYWSADGIHLTPAGHQLVADAWLAGVKV